MATNLSNSARASFGHQDISRGDALYHLGMVHVDEIGTGGARGTVGGQAQDHYEVLLDFSEIREGELGVDCDCPRFQDAFCKHVWAFIQACNEFELPFSLVDELDLFDVDDEYWDLGRPLRKTIAIHGGTTTKAKKRKPASNLPQWQKQLIAISQTNEPKSFRTLPAFHRDLATEQQLWFALSLADFATSQPLTVYTYQSKRKKDGQFGKPQSKSINPTDVSRVSDPLERNALALLVSNDDSLGRYRYYTPSCSAFTLQPQLVLPSLAALAATGRFAWTMDASQYLAEPQVLTFDEGQPWSLTVDISPNVGTDGKQRIQVTPRLVRRARANESEEVLAFSDVVGISEDGALLQPNTIGAIKTQHVPLARAFQATGKIEVPSRNMPALMEQVVTWHGIPINLHPELPVERTDAHPAPKLHLSSPERTEHYLRADVIFKYDQHEIDSLATEPLLWDPSSKSLIQRDLGAEEAWLAQLPAEAFRKSDFDTYISLPRTKLPEIVAHLTRLEWEIVADGNVMRRAGSFNISVESGLDWFDVHATADFDGQSVSLPELLKAQRKGLQYIVLDDGSHGILPEQWLAKFGDLEKAGSVADDAIRFTQTQALLLDAMLEEQQDVSFDRAFKAWCEKLNSFSGIAPATAPENFQGELREYQQLGLGWLNFLNEFRLGGCLADDMGLGKTIQVLSLLEQRRTRELTPSEPRLPSLIVVPKSLIFNWIEEAKKFTPQLNIVSYHGTSRADYRDSLDKYDAIVTTYGTLRNDAAILRDKTFDYVILDEAQAIKNPNSISSKACRLMKAEHRLAMTGTPVENHLGDLWSLFDFLNPGMLGHTLGAATVAANAESEERLGHVAKALRPFILRRTKQQVLTELPEKTEQTLYCDMEPKQKKLYNELRDHYRQLITGKVKELGIAKSKMHVLEALLRLRQTACDPRLVNPKCGVKGTKLELVVQQLEELAAEGHKALVFSQFTSLLALLREDLDKKKWNYEYLDGKTRKRDAAVKRFQEDENCNIFLISLKAGGNGLNLTAADYVFILDPWWNPAVEAQAIDRAHRMGQTKSVNAYRMICRDTVEEKIIELQSSKRKLADAIISQKQSLISDLTSDDLRMLFE